MANGHEFGRRTKYEIRVQGNLGEEWADWFDGFRIIPQGGETSLVGEVIDQVALHGLLAKIRDLGLTLMRVERLE